MEGKKGHSGRMLSGSMGNSADTACLRWPGYLESRDNELVVTGETAMAVVD